MRQWTTSKGILCGVLPLPRHSHRSLLKHMKMMKCDVHASSHPVCFNNAELTWPVIPRLRKPLQNMAIKSQACRECFAYLFIKYTGHHICKDSSLIRCLCVNTRVLYIGPPMATHGTTHVFIRSIGRRWRRISSWRCKKISSVYCLVYRPIVAENKTPNAVGLRHTLTASIIN